MDYKSVVEWWQSDKFDYSVLLSNFRVVFACNSNSIEGSSLTYNTTRGIFEDNKVTSFTGLVSDLLEVQNQKFAFEYIYKSLLEKKPITVDFIKKVHRLMFYGCYDDVRWSKGERPGQFKKGDYCVGISSEGSYPDEVDSDIEELIEEINSYDGDKILTAVAYFHLRFEQIHPFADGNGRAGRLLLNYYLLLHGYPPTVIFSEDKDTYYMSLEVFDRTGNIDGFMKFLEEQTVKTWSKRLERRTHA